MHIPTAEAPGPRPPQAVLRRGMHALLIMALPKQPARRGGCLRSDLVQIAWYTSCWMAVPARHVRQQEPR